MDEPAAAATAAFSSAEQKPRRMQMQMQMQNKTSKTSKLNAHQRVIMKKKKALADTNLTQSRRLQG
jgi:hypothetical protein